jgi:hypothetical protein
MHSKEEELLLATEVAALSGVSVHTLERVSWSRHCPPRSRQECSCLHCWPRNACADWPPKGVWAIPRGSLRQLEAIGKPVGYPRGKARKRPPPSSCPRECGA